MAVNRLILIFFGFALIANCQHDSNKKHNDGSVVIRHFENFHSEYVAPRHVDVLLPPGYSQNESQRYAVLIMHDGQMLFDSTTTWNHQEWGVDEMVGKLHAENKVQPFIVIGVWNTEKRFAEYLPQKPALLFPDTVVGMLRGFSKSDIQSDDYLRFLTRELLPFIEKEYRVLPGKEHRFIAGSSMGGLISLYAICEYPEIFGGAACLSTHWPIAYHNDYPVLPHTLIDYFAKKLPDPNSHKIYFDYGTATLDSLYQPHQRLMDMKMKERGYVQEINWITRAFSGADHSERAWSQRLDVPLLFLLGKEKSSN